MSKRAKKLSTRILSIALLVCMLVTQFAFIPTAFAASVQSTELLMNTYSSDLYIYNYLCYTDGTGTVRTNSASGIFVIKNNSNFDIHIGDVKDVEGDKRPMDSDIDVELNGLSMATDKKLFVSAINGGKRKLDIDVRNATSIPTLVIEDNAKVTITLYSDVTIGLITLGEGSSLEINTNGYIANVDTISGYGNLTVSGNGTLSTDSVSANDILLNAVTIQGEGSSSVTAEKSITVNSATLKDLSLFGFNSSATGKKSITFNGGKFSNVTTVGVDKTSNAVVTVSGFNGITSSENTKYVFDYLITYKAADTVLTPMDTWPTSYRVEHDSPSDSSTKIVGYVANDIFTSSDIVVLPGYDVGAFYGHAGWLLNDTTIKELVATQNGDVTLIAKLESGTVTVDRDLGYTPDSSSNDTPIPPKNHTSTVKIDDTIILESPTRFGYVFKGWKVISGKRNQTYTGGSSYTVDTNDLEEVAGTQTYILKMEAQWEEDSFPVRFILTSMVDKNYVHFSKDGGANWLDLNSFVSLYSDSIPYDNGIFSPKELINYGENFGEYVKRIFGGEVLIKDTTGTYTFTGWMLTDTATPVSPSEEYRYGGGFLIKPESVDTLTEWTLNLKRNPISFSTIWRETDQKYTLTVQNRGEWTVLIDGTSNASNRIEVSVGSVVTLSCDTDVAKTSITHWSVPASAGTVTERGKPDENGNVFYDFTMPDEDININLSSVNTSSSTDPLMVDLAKGDITFDVSVSHNGRVHSGFWYKDDAEDMTPLYYDSTKGAYFYIWNPAEPFFVTTNNVDTKNQLTIMQQMDGGIHLKNCIMVARDEYLNDAVGRKLKGTLIEKSTAAAPTGLPDNMGIYGNIVLGNKVVNAYTTSIFVHGPNTVAAIFPSNYNGSYISTLNINGDDPSTSILTLGTVTCLGKLNTNQLTINSNLNENFSRYEYLICTLTSTYMQDDVHINNTVIKAPEKRLYNSYEYVQIDSSTHNSNIEIGSMRIAYGLKLNAATTSTKQTYVRVRKDINTVYYLIDMSRNSSMVVDGGIYSGSISTSYGNGSLSNRGYLIVKGLGIIGTNLKINNANATVIANLITANRGSTFSNGVVVTNHLLNPPVKYSLDKGFYVTTPYESSVSSTFPFYSLSNTQATSSTYNFSGSKVYLFGYHKGDSNIYDVNSGLSDKNNPVGKILESLSLLDANGDLKESLRSSPKPTEVSNSAKNAVLEYIESGIYSDKECIQIGNATHTSSSNYPKTVKISGGEIYAAGSLTFFNETTVTGGTVVCGGSFSSKRDLMITKGNITAKEVGIVGIIDEVGTSDKLLTVESGAKRYDKLTLKGGTIKTGHIGTLTKTYNGKIPRGVLDLNITATLVSNSENPIGVSTDLYFNYFYDTGTYKIEGNNPTFIRFDGIYKDNKVQELSQNAETVITAPSLKPSGTAMWLYDDPNGNKINTVAKDGLVNGSVDIGNVLSRCYISVYAAKTNYNLTVKGDYETGFTVSYTQNDLNANGNGSVTAKDKVTVKLNSKEMYERTIIWYKDAAGLMHNVSKTSNPETYIYTFEMPYSDVEVIITEEHTLMLDEYTIVFTDTGFGVEEKTDTRRADSLFEYHGNYRITQKNINEATYNRIIFETPGSGNAGNTKIVLNDIMQKTLGVLVGVEIANGAQVELTVSNSASNVTSYLAPVSVPENASFTLVGTAKDKFGFATEANLSSYFAVGHTTGKAGNISFKNLEFNLSAYHMSMADSNSKTNSKVLYEDCIIKDIEYYFYDGFGENMGEVIVKNCNFYIKTSLGVSNELFSQCGDVYYIDSVITYSSGTDRECYNVFYNGYGDNGTYKNYIENSEFTIGFNHSDAKNYNEQVKFAGNLVLSKNSIVRSGERMMLRSIVLKDNAQFIAHDGEGYLLCPDITVEDSATLNVGYLILNGFVTNQYETESDLLSNLAQGKVLDGKGKNGLVVNGGAVFAKYCLGGAKNTNITVNSGTVTAKSIGTLDEFYGYWKHIPPKDSNKFMYTYSVIPENMGAMVNINGGTVNVADGGYLGGMFSTVNITGGEVSLGNGAVLGINEAQKTLMYNNATSNGQLLTNAVIVTASGGQIEGDTVNTPYGSTVISGTASANVANLTALNGSITIITSSLSYSNPYTGADAEDTKAGVVINNTLDGLNVLINNKSVVYANNAYTTADLGKNGYLEVSNKAHLYIGNEYGSRGNGTAEVIVINEGHIYGNTIYYITYILMDDDIDRATNGNNPITYNWGNNTIDLYNPTRPGYEFAGWYGTEDYSDEKVTAIATNAARNITLYAKWTPKTVNVVIKINAADIGMTEEALELETHGLGEISGGVFTYDRVASVSYRDKILGEGDGHINLANYVLATLGVKELKIGNTNQYLDGNTTITRDMLDNDLVLYVTKAAKTKIKVSLDLNLVVKGEYSYSKYNNIKDFDEDDSVTLRSSYVDIGETVSTANGFVDDSYKLIVPTAAGFTFGGWYTDKDFTNKVEESYVINAEFGGMLYAKWIANEYYIEFDSEDGNNITSGNSAPLVSDNISKLVAKISYNSRIDTAEYFFKLDNGAYVPFEQALDILPFAWKEGYTFDGEWYYTDAYGYKRNISPNTVFTYTNVYSEKNNGTEWYKTEAKVENGAPVSAITFLPRYAKINIIYDLNGGHLVGEEWKADYDSFVEKHGRYEAVIKEPNKSLIGYSTIKPADSSHYSVEREILNDYGKSFYVISTSISYFSTNSTYVTNDYRGQIINKGYTFKGWRLMEEVSGGVLQPEKDGENDVYIGCFPRYEDVIVQAVWEANTYNIKLNPFDVNNQSQYAKFSHGVDDIVQIELTVGEEIDDHLDEWPSRDTKALDPWFAYDATKDKDSIADNDKRYLLGFTFDALDPGVNNNANEKGFAVYHKYSEDVTDLINRGCIYTHKNKQTVGSIFGLPSDDNYHEGIDIDGIDSTVPDYPNGSTVEMYAVYRERSLVFVEHYVDNNGISQEKVLKSYPWETWIDFLKETEFTDSKQQIEAFGYTFLKLGVNSKAVSASEYPSNAEEYGNKLGEYKKAAEDFGTYDIMVYTIFVAQVVEDATLDASSDPLKNNSEVFEYIIPNSMQAGSLTYKITGLTDFDIVDKNDLEVFNSSAGDNTAAILAVLYNKEGEEISKHWLNSVSGSAADLFEEKQVGSGWRIEFTLYHSSVMTKEASHSFVLTLGFKSDDLKDQHITLNTTINMTPSLYDVEYEAVLPSDPIVENWNGFSDTPSHILTVENFKYGDNLISTVPVVEGYDANGKWKTNTNKELSYGNGLIADSDAENAVNSETNVIRLTTDWIIKQFKLSATEKLLEKWDIYYGATKLTGTSPVEVNYRTDISFELKTQVGEYPEFAWIRIGDTDGQRVDTYGVLSGGKYVFKMPADDVDSYYNRLIELYLELGNLNVNAGGYSINEDSFVWRGDYAILMDENNNTDQSETSNVLTLVGDLKDRDIYLGDLNITSENSVSLYDANVILTAKYGGKDSKINAKNIRVSSTSSMIMDNGSLDLTPESGVAGIGGISTDAKNGSITLNNVTVELTMGPSESSGIGPADKVSGGGDIDLNDCTVTVTEKTGIGSSYSGTWIGSNGVGNVTLDNTDVLLGDGSDMIFGPTVLKGNSVTLTGCNIGTESVPLIDPIYAKDILTINDTIIHQDFQTFDKGFAIGTEESGTISVTNSKISSMVIDAEKLYSGKLLINDAVSRVVIANTRILEAKHGDITITSSGVTQGSEYFAHTNRYLIIKEISGEANNLTVDSITNLTVLTVIDADFKNVNINTDVEILLNESVRLNKLTVADGKTVAMDASSGADLVITEIDGTTSGSYEQEGGTLSGEKLGIGGNMTLTNVTANGSEYIGSFGADGVTTVTIDGGSVTFADKIGALGEHNSTFTFVVLENTPTVSGMLVQDHYRINYNSSGTESLPTVLRSETNGSTVTYMPSVPDGPTRDTNFLFWYYLNGEDKIGIGNSANGTTVFITGLTADQIEFADAKDTDGTRTLQLYAWVNITIEGVVSSGNIYDEFNANTNTVTIYPTGAFTAMYKVNGSVMANSSYEITLDTPFKTGTVLTLGVISDNIPSFYYYRCNGTEKTIKLSSFIKMGTSDVAPTLLGAAPGTALADILVIVADFTEVSGNENVTSHKMTLNVVVAGNTVASNDKVSYNTNSYSNVTVGEAENVVIEHNGDIQYDGEDLFLIVNVNGKTDIPLNAYVGFDKLTNVVRLNEHSWYVKIGEAKAELKMEIAPRFEGFGEGEYTVEWILVRSRSADDNIMGNTVATAGGSFAVKDAARDEMNVTLLTVDGTREIDRTLNVGSEHIATFSYSLSPNAKMEMMGELLTDEAGYIPVEDISLEQTDNGITAKFGRGLSAGTYRITFSIDANNTDDNVYFLFIIE